MSIFKKISYKTLRNLFRLCNVGLDKYHIHIMAVKPNPRILKFTKTKFKGVMHNMDIVSYIVPFGTCEIHRHYTLKNVNISPFNTFNSLVVLSQIESSKFYKRLSYFDRIKYDLCVEKSINSIISNLISIERNSPDFDTILVTIFENNRNEFGYEYYTYCMEIAKDAVTDKVPESTPIKPKYSVKNVFKESIKLPPLITKIHGKS